MSANNTDDLTDEIKISSHGKINGQPNPVDVHIGDRIRLRRLILGYTQPKLASLLGVTSQQIQKYEKGINRIPASRLFDLACVLQTSPNYFYEDMDDQTKNQSPMSTALKKSNEMFLEESGEIKTDVMQTKETLELVQSYHKLSNPIVAKSILLLIKLLAKSCKNIIYQDQKPEQSLNTLLRS